MIKLPDVESNVTFPVVAVTPEATPILISLLASKVTSVLALIGALAAMPPATESSVNSPDVAVTPLLAPTVISPVVAVNVDRLPSVYHRRW